MFSMTTVEEPVCPNVLYLPNNAADSPPPVHIRNTGYDTPCILWAMWPMKDRAQETKKEMKNPIAGGRWENPGEDDNGDPFFWQS